MTTKLDVNNLDRPPWLSGRANLVIKSKNEVSIAGEAWLGDKRTAIFTWAPDGRLLYEKPIGKDGRPHGLEVQRDDDGRAIWCTRWVSGSMHGPAIQLDNRGRPAMVTWFVRGKGNDIWTGGGKVGEMRQIEDGVPHGLERWGDPRRPSEEWTWRRGKKHGIFRRWDDGARLAKDFPQFFIHDRRVTRARYEKACVADPTLPHYEERDDVPKREIPRDVEEALRRARQLREEMEQVEAMRAYVSQPPAINESPKRSRRR